MYYTKRNKIETSELEQLRNLYEERLSFLANKKRTDYEDKQMKEIKDFFVNLYHRFPMMIYN